MSPIGAASIHLSIVSASTGILPSSVGILADKRRELQNGYSLYVVAIFDHPFRGSLALEPRHVMSYDRFELSTTCFTLIETV